MFYISLSLLVWLTVGFIIGIKEALVDEWVTLTKNEIEQHYKDNHPNASKEEIEIGVWFNETYYNKKLNVITINTLGGFYSLLLHIKMKMDKE